MSDCATLESANRNDSGEIMARSSKTKEGIVREFRDRMTVRSQGMIQKENLTRKHSYIYFTVIVHVRWDEHDLNLNDYNGNLEILVSSTVREWE